MGAKIQPPSAECGIGSEHEHIFIALIFQDIPKVCHFLEERVLRVHFIKRPSLIRKFLSYVDLEWQCRRLCKESAHGKGRSGENLPSVEKTRISGKIISFPGELRELRDIVVGESAAFRCIRIGHFHGFQVQIDQIPFFFRKLDVDVSGIDIVILYKTGVVHLIPDIAAEIKSFPRK